MNEKPQNENKRLKLYSTELRNHATTQENTLWYRFLRTYPIQFNRQRIIGNYIVDFYCFKAKLIIEIDGGQHYEDKAITYDKQRTQYLESKGFKVIRFTNTDIDKNIDGVCFKIDNEIKNRVSKEGKRTTP